MPAFQYRAIMPDGSSRRGSVNAADMTQAVGTLRGMGGILVDVQPSAVSTKARGSAPKAAANAASALMIGELAVLLRAGLPLDRALALAIGNIEPKSLGEKFEPLLVAVREGQPLSGAFAKAPDLLTPTAVAMTEAGEASGKLSESLTRLAEMLEQAAELRRLVITSMIYPIALLIIAVGVVMLMLLVVVPQFEALMSKNMTQLPAASQWVMWASSALRANGLILLLGLAAIGIGLRFAFARPTVRLAFDRLILNVPQLGALLRRLDTARFARTLGALVEGQVSLPTAVTLAQRTIRNRYMNAAMSRIADGIREGDGLAGPLAAARIVPDIAIGFVRTGEESSELGMMLSRLGDVLDRDVKVRLSRVVAILTPLITVVLGAT
ncbi:type II secretion system F family protein, partial [Sphingomonas sp.]|uniref:type II secretion system F family protein n=1 Tax=Sphingomonas sp. TaxID=28214 RepID=UPI0025E07DD1